MKRQATDFGYALRSQGDGWRWQTYDKHGRVRESGDAHSRAAAAAFVIRSLVAKTLAAD